MREDRPASNAVWVMPAMRHMQAQNDHKFAVASNTGRGRGGVEWRFPETMRGRAAREYAAVAEA